MKKAIIIKNSIAASLILFAGTCSSENNSEQEHLNKLSLEELYALPFVGIATQTAVPLEKAPSVASLITEQDIKAMGALTIDEALESVPGLHSSLSTLNSDRIYSIRGIKTGLSPQVLIMLNGNRISSDVLTGTVAYLAKINVQNISRIEVIRGPGSAIYGADAYSGVINIITKSAKELDGFYAGIKTGSNRTRNIWGQYGGVIGNNWDLALNLEFAQQGADDSQKVNSDQQTLLDPIANSFGYNSASLAPGNLNYNYKSVSYNFHLSDKQWKIGLDGWNQRDLGVGSGNAQSIDYDGSGEIDHYLLSIQYSNRDWLDDWMFTGLFSYQYLDANYDFNLFPAGTVLPIGTDGNFDNPQAPINPPVHYVHFPDGYKGKPGRTSKIPLIEFTASYNGFLAHSFRFNTGIKQEDLEASESKNFGPGVIDGTISPISGAMVNVTNTPYIYVTDEKRTIKYLSVQDIWELNVDWTLTTGLRYDHYSDFGSTTNPRVALVWSTSDELITKFMYGSAFRAPSFVELYTQNNPVGIGNRKLKPEKIHTYEVAMLWQPLANFKSNLNLYHFNTKNMIDFIPRGAGNTAQNNKSLDGKGIELEVNWQPNKKWNLIANYSYQQTKNKKTGDQEPFIPKQQLYFDTRWKFLPGWMLSSQLLWIGETDRAANDNRQKNDDYNIINLTLRRQSPSKKWEMAAILKNVFNSDAREPSNGSITDDYRLNERRGYIELRYHFN